MCPVVSYNSLVWYRNDIVRRFRSSARDERDIHHRLMMSYKEVPAWWYGLVGVVSTVIIVIAIEIFDTKLPVWGAALAMLFAAITALPLVMIQAVANTSISFGVVYEMIIGFMLPGRPIANAIFKSIGFMGSTQAATFCGDLKLGHYMKIPPRTMFMVQVVSVVLASIFSVATQEWMFNNIADICTPGQKQGFTCPASNIFATATVIWGAIGPARMFGPGAPYVSNR